MVSSFLHGRLRNAVTWVAVLACLLVGPLGQGAFALCLGGGGHVAVEALPHGDHGSAIGSSTANADAFALLNMDNRPCIDIPLIQNAKPINHQPSVVQDGPSAAATLVAINPPIGPPSARILRLSSQVSSVPGLIQRRTVVLLI